MQRNNRELWLAFFTILGITALYLLVVVQANRIPPASELFGHTLGILGFLLMLMTETLYSWRKRNRSARWGRMSTWLKFHIYTGLVGPYMVLLHSSWKFNGLAGVLTLLTIIIVVSGIIGRYIYTSIPRTPEGAEIEAAELERQIRLVEERLRQWASSSDQTTQQLARRMASIPATAGTPIIGVLARQFYEWDYRLQWWREKRRLSKTARAQANQLQKLLNRQRALQRQVASLAVMRRLLSLWHTVHIPIGMALFTVAFIHIGAAIYYATLLR